MSRQELEKITQFEVRVVENCRERHSGMLRADGTGIHKVKGLGPEVDCNLVCVSISLEVRWGLTASSRRGCWGPWKEAEGWPEKSVAGRLVFEGVASQSQGVDSWRRLGTGNFLFAQARARWSGFLQTTHTCCLWHEVLVQSSYHDQASQISDLAIEGGGLVGCLASFWGVSDNRGEGMKGRQRGWKMAVWGVRMSLPISPGPIRWNAEPINDRCVLLTICSCRRAPL